MLRTTAIAAGIAAMTTLGAGAAAADTVEVKMLNRGPDGNIMVYDPPVVQVEPGDTIVWKSTDPGHNAQSIDELTPEGAESWKGGINKEVSVTLETEGVYAYKCLPHYATGMVGIVIVGDTTEGLEDIAEYDFPGRAQQRMDEYVAMVRDMM